MHDRDPDNFRFRQIHLDFHTSEHIPDVGADFDPDQFVQVLKDGAVDSVTLFARCHHGWAYYPTQIGKPHPHLQRPDLLGDMVRACRAADIETPIYMTVQWDELTAREHPEWRVMSALNTPAHYAGTEPSAMHQLTPAWHTICLNHPGYIDYVIALTKEVCNAYAPPALFMDIVGSNQCVCPACLESTVAMGQDPTTEAGRRANDKARIMDFFERFTTEINSDFPDVRIFYNSGHVFKDKERYQHYGQVEIESLPTGGWGYDHFPASARYADGLGLPMLGMTGRFHTHWGEFGGFKRPEALIFECCQMLAMGTHCSIGDQLHPRGAMDPAIYKLIRPAYERVRQLEPYARGAEYQADVALLVVESQNLRLSSHTNHRIPASDRAAARTFLEMQIPFDAIDADADFAKYQLIVLPDEVRLDKVLQDKLADYVAQGGAVLSTGQSGLTPDGQWMALDIGADLSGTEIAFDPSYVSFDNAFDSDLPATPLVMYQKPLPLTATDAEVLAVVRPSYFNRNWAHFCSHLHTPENPGADDLGPAMLRKGRVMHCAYPLFSLYGATGQVLYKYMLRGMIDALYPDRLLSTNLPSATRMSLMRQPNEGRDVLHVLYAPTQLRGSGMAITDSELRQIEVIEDAPWISDGIAHIRRDHAPGRVRCAYSDAELVWEFEGGYLSISLPQFHIHAAVVIDDT